MFTFDYGRWRLLGVSREVEVWTLTDSISREPPSKKNQQQGTEIEIYCLKRFFFKPFKKVPVCVKTTHILSLFAHICSVYFVSVCFTSLLFMNMAPSAGQK